MKSTLVSIALAFLGCSALALVGARADDAAAPGSGPVAAKLQPFVDGGVLAGAVTLVANKEKVLDLEAVGYADIAHKTPMKTDSIFWIASQSKAMTAAGLMMLVDEGKVNVEDPVEKYLPEFRGQMVAVEQDGDHVLLKKPDHPIKVREVLSHTSGLPFMSRAEEVPHKIDSLTLKEAALTYALTPLKFQPGTKYDYSNAGINTAGRIIEVVSKMPYEQFMQQRLLDPLGMKDTTFFPTEEQVKRIVRSYHPGPDKKGLVEMDVDQLTYPLTSKDRHPSPAGGYFSTAADVGRFCQMLLNGGTLDGKQYLSPASVQQMSTTQTGEILNHGKGESGYGFGLSTSRMAKGEPTPGNGGNFGHGGAYSTGMDIDPRLNLIRVFLVQAAGFPGNGNEANGAFQQASEVFAKK